MCWVGIWQVQTSKYDVCKYNIIHTKIHTLILANTGERYSAVTRSVVCSRRQQLPAASLVSVWSRESLSMAMVQFSSGREGWGNTLPLLWNILLSSDVQFLTILLIWKWKTKINNWAGGGPSLLLWVIPATWRACTECQATILANLELKRQSTLTQQVNRSREIVYRWQSRLLDLPSPEAWTAATATMPLDNLNFQVNGILTCSWSWCESVADLAHQLGSRENVIKWLRLGRLTAGPWLLFIFLWTTTLTGLPAASLQLPPWWREL